MGNEKDERAERHQRAMAKQKSRVDAAVRASSREQGVAVLLTGDGKGKSSSAFGIVMRALGRGQRVAVVQFIKGEQLSGEELYLGRQHPEVTLVQMGTGFTWDTQDRETDRKAAEATWAEAGQVLQDPGYDLVVLDELTYMLAFDYLAEEKVLNAIEERPRSQSVVVTGRGGGAALRARMDTVSEIKNLQHAFEQGIKARPGVDY